jgi:tRNA(fMet)-specific endonuclease VapC
MTHLLDTNTCVQFLRSGAGSPVAAKLASMPPASVVLCSVVVGELLFGALRSRDAARNLAEVQKFTAGFASLAFDDRAAPEYADIRADLTARGLLIGPNDLLIAAIARANGLTLVTHNTAEFSRVPGLRLEDWQTP